MPAIYAHDRFGEAVISHLPLPLRTTLEKYPSALRLGFQGPDILFYHKPFKKNATKKKGMDIHHIPPEEFFVQHAVRLLEENPNLKPSPYLSYVAGAMCHFLLDTKLHPYVYKIEDTGVTHAKIESEFDKHLLRVDKKPVRGMNTAKAYLPDENTVNACAKVFEVNPSEAKRSIKTMRTINGLFACRCQLVHAVCHGFLKIVRLDNSFGDMFRRKKNADCCKEPNKVLEKLLDDNVMGAMKRVNAYFTELSQIAESGKMDSIFSTNYTGGVH